MARAQFNNSAKSKALALERVEPLIHEIRGEKVILDSDLAWLYGVSTKRLNEQVKRNRERFPADFAFQLTAKESAAQRSQFARRLGKGTQTTARHSWKRIYTASGS